MNKLSISNFFDKYIFEPNSSDLSEKSQVKAWAITLSVGILTFGLVHLAVTVTNLVRFQGRITHDIPSKSTSEQTNTIGTRILNEQKIRNELEARNTKKEDIESTIIAIKEIISKSTVFGQPINYKNGMAYLRKDEKLPFTLEAYETGEVYIHFKSNATQQKEVLGKACQKIVYKAINQAGEAVAAAVIKEKIPEHNVTTYETEKKAMEKFKGCKYLLQGFNASSYSSKDKISEKYGIICEYCDGHADRELLDKLPLKQRLTFFLNIMEGAQAMHERKFVHFDLKPDNILYKKVGNNFEPRIIDFGVMHPMGEVLEHGTRGAELPPEYRMYETFPITVSEKVDVWALCGNRNIED